MGNVIVSNITRTPVENGSNWSSVAVAPPPAAGLLYSQNFESAGWESEFTGSAAWSDNVAVVTNDPHSGTKSLRGNQISAVTDGITGLTGIASTLLDWRGSGGNIAGLTPNECQFDYWFRHDDYNHVLVDDGTGEGKLLWFVDNTHGTEAMFISNQLAGTDSLRLVYANGGYSSQWATDNWGYSELYISNAGVSSSTTGTWQKFTYYINYDEKYVQIYVNDLIMKSSNHGDPAYAGILTADGRSYYDPALTLKTKGFQFFWTRESNIDGSTDGTGYAAGWQIDDLAVYDTKQGV